MRKAVKRRPYRSQLRTAAAAETRRAILDAARALFIRRGYAATTIAAVAERADVAVDTVYATVGKKLDLFLLLLESAISGRDEPVDAESRDYVIAIRAARGAREKLRIYAGAVANIAPRLAPLHSVLRAAAQAEPALAELWSRIASRRAANMRLFAQDLLATGELRRDLEVDKVADVIWSMNGPEYYVLLVVERKWNVDEFADWLHDAWCRLLLRDFST
jgi:AcrR family transcriptional regulator